MINLLPEERKHEIRAARTNVILLRYNFITIGGMILLVAFCIVFYAILRNNEQKALATSSANTQKSASLASVRTAADDYRTNLTLAGKVIGNGVSYTDIVIDITKLMPAGSILDGLTLGGTSFGQQVSFEAQATSYGVAEQLKQNFQTSSLFTNVFFQSVGYDSSGSTPQTKKYPVSVTMSAKMNSTAGVTK